jgi:hypothetical protein
MPKESSIVDVLQQVLDSVDLDKDERLYEPVPPKDFFLSEYHCGFPSTMIPKFWLDEAIDFIEGGYNELIITGSLGSFKTTWANLILLYKMYELFSYKSIHAYFGLPKIQDIYNIYFNVNLTQARLTGFNQLKNMIDESQWYISEYPRNKLLNSIIEFAKQPAFKFLSGSGHQHAIGMTIWSFILDEGDFFKKNGAGFDESYSYVTNMYTELVDRRKSRFQNGEKDLSFSVLISSASFQSSFVEKRIAEAAVDDKIKVVKAIQYKVVPEKHSDKKFCVFVGDVMVDPEMINSTQDFNLLFKKLGYQTEVDPKLDIMEAYESLPPDLKMKFETPPVDLKDRFDKNLGKALQNFCGVFIAAEGKLFQSKSLLFSAYKKNIVHPFSKEKIVLSNGDRIKLQDYFTPHMLTYLDRPHALHQDGSITGDSTGLSMVRYDGMVGNMRKYTQVFSIEILPPPNPFRIKLSKLRDFVIYLMKDLGVNIVKFTQDQFQSEDNLQLLADEGLTVARQSIDKSDKPYLSWIGLLVDECIDMYKYPVLEEEAFGAIHYIRKQKVDHPPGENGPNINVLQSFVGALYNLVTLDAVNMGSTDYNVTLPDIKGKKGVAELNQMVGTPVYTNNIIGAMGKGLKQRNAYNAILDI